MKEFFKQSFKILREIFTILYKFCRGVIRLAFNVLVLIVMFLIKELSGEKNKGVTKRKLKRIRRMTNFKLFTLKYLPHVMTFLGWKNYLTDLKRRMKDEL